MNLLMSFRTSKKRRLATYHSGIHIAEHAALSNSKIIKIKKKAHSLET